MQQETLILWIALVSYTLAGSLAIAGALLRIRVGRPVLVLLFVGIALLTLALGLRWVRLGHGPYTTMFEILASNLWSLSLVYTIALWRLPVVRPTSAIVAPLFFVMMGWLLLSNPGAGNLPATYDTIWLYIHIGLGKIFLGSVLVAVGLAGVILVRRWAWAGRFFERMPTNEALDELAYRFMAMGLVFDTLMLVTGAIWAQDAWGRYWGWDPLETWSFITWLLLGGAIHLRLTVRPRPWLGAVMIMLVFGLAFLTFFGMPFISVSPHKGAV